MFKFLSFLTRTKEAPVVNSKVVPAPIGDFRNYLEDHMNLSQDYHELSVQLFDATSEKIDLLQRIDQLEAENARLGNGLVEITQQVTTGANATVKRMANIALASLKVDA